MVSQLRCTTCNTTYTYDHHPLHKNTCPACHQPTCPGCRQLTSEWLATLDPHTSIAYTYVCSTCAEAAKENADKLIQLGLANSLEDLRENKLKTIKDKYHKLQHYRNTHSNRRIPIDPKTDDEIIQTLQRILLIIYGPHPWHIEITSPTSTPETNLYTRTISIPRRDGNGNRQRAIDEMISDGIHEAGHARYDKLQDYEQVFKASGAYFDERRTLRFGYWAQKAWNLISDFFLESHIRRIYPGLDSYLALLPYENRIQRELVQRASTDPNATNSFSIRFYTAVHYTLATDPTPLKALPPELQALGRRAHRLLSEAYQRGDTLTTRVQALDQLLELLYDPSTATAPPDPGIQPPLPADQHDNGAGQPTDHAQEGQSAQGEGSQDEAPDGQTSQDEAPDGQPGQDGQGSENPGPDQDDPTESHAPTDQPTDDWSDSAENPAEKPSDSGQPGDGCDPSIRLHAANVSNDIDPHTDLLELYQDPRADSSALHRRHNSLNPIKLRIVEFTQRDAVPHIAAHTRRVQRLKPAIDAYAKRLRFRNVAEHGVDSGHRSGTIDRRAVHRLPTINSTNIFYRKIERQLPKVRVAILIDDSGSMYGLPAETARDMACILGYALSRIVGVTLHIATYSSYLHIFQHMAAVDGAPFQNGGTPTGAAIDTFCSWIEPQASPDEQLWMFVLTDGQSQTSQNGIRSHPRWTFVQLGIHTHGDVGYHHYLGPITNPADITTTMLDAIEQVLKQSLP